MVPGFNLKDYNSPWFLSSAQVKFYFYIHSTINALKHISALFKPFKSLCAILFVIGATRSVAQVKMDESQVLKQIAESKTDSQKIMLLCDYSSRLGFSNSAKGLEYALRSVGIAQNSHYVPGRLIAYEAAGDAYWCVFDYNKSVDYYLKELKLADSLNLPLYKAKANYNIGWIKCVQQNVYSERSKLLNSLHYFESVKDTTFIIRVCNGLSSVYQNYYLSQHKQADSAFYYYKKMIELGENGQQKNNLVTIYGNYSTFLIQHSKYDEAKKYLVKSVDIARATNDSMGYLNNVNILGLLYYCIDSSAKAKKIFDEIVPVLKAKDSKPNLQDAYHTLYMIYDKEKNYKKALEYHVLFKDITDSLNAIVLRANIQEKETAYEINKREENIRKLQQMNELSELRNKQNNYVILGMSLLGILVIGFAVNLHRGNKNKQKANFLLSEQNRIIAEKKNEIEQSIEYARGIQNAMLPSIDEVKRVIPGSFIIYLPKDVVSGDFYWMAEIQEPGAGVATIPGMQSNVLLAAADCTGHGVPGSLMSIVSIDKLNHAVIGKKIYQPSGILGSINNDIKNALKQEQVTNKQKDGLDIALVKLDRENKKLVYSGAHRPLWIVRQGNIIEIKPIKTSIAGHTPYDQNFEEHEIELEKNDLVIMSSDGYADQFGGGNGKKMMTRNFKNHLLEVAGQDIHKIENSLLQHFLSWKGHYEQVDDVLVIGVKI
jgi:serine phosphatase RsbU (regulator of sigma subunit)